MTKIPGLGLGDVDHNNNEHDASAVETTVLDLEAIERLPETNQLCRSVKRKLLDDFRRAQKKKKVAATQNDEPKRVEMGGSPASTGSEDEGPARNGSLFGGQETGCSPDSMPDLTNESSVVPAQYQFLLHPFEKLECDLCSARFATEQAIQDHKYFFHSVAKEFKCNMCVKEYFTEEELALHKEAKHRPKTIPCEVCFKRFGSAQGLSDHQRAVHGIIQASAPSTVTPPPALVPRLPSPPTKPPPTAPKDVLDEYYRQLGIYYEYLWMTST
ncbi:zinc finger and SCAN domain-containing protein 5A-like protein [Aphelenchoides avenae]|nr:zinc finger and SCAN domain-containing protein 5A-like protein [Aphelenchus avenae]